MKFTGTAPNQLTKAWRLTLYHRRLSSNLSVYPLQIEKRIQQNQLLHEQY